MSLQVRVVAYSQFLESYKSVTLESMAAAFDVGVDFLDSGEVLSVSAACHTVQTCLKGIYCNQAYLSM